MAKRLCGHILTEQKGSNSMDRSQKKGVVCMKWDSNGELSSHDSHKLITRLAKAEKSRRTMLDHHDIRRVRSSARSNEQARQKLAS